MARSLLAAGTELVVATPRPSPLRSLEGRPGVPAVLTGSDLTADELAAALDRRVGPPSSSSMTPSCCASATLPTCCGRSAVRR